MKPRQRRNGISSGAAIGMLLVCAGIAAFSLRGQFGSAPASGDGGTSSVMDDLLADEAMPGDQDELPGVDLLLRHGSWSAQVPVQMAFAHAVDAAMVAAPAGETAASAPPWIGADPPAMRLGVLMVGEAARRAVVDGRVVGIGDVVGMARVVAIERDTVTTLWGGKRLTYDLEDDHPREFRAELRRRGAERPAAPANGTAEPIQEQRQ